MVAGALALIMVLGACSNAAGSASGGTGAPGVSATEVDVGSLANVSGPVSADFAPIVKGVQAYFDMVNATGGVYGRKLVLKYQLDDQGIPTQDSELSRTLVTQDHVFAVVGVGTPFFSGAKYLAQHSVPAFGYQVSADWSDGPTLFGQNGSYIDTSTIASFYPWLAQQLHAHSVAVLSYGITESKAGCQAAVNSLQHFNVLVSYQDLAIGFGAELSPDVLQIKSHHSDLVVSCLDLTGNVALSRALRQNELASVQQLWLNGYDRDQLAAYPTIMDGVYFYLQHVPFEADAAYPGTYPGMHNYLRTMQRYEPSATYNEVALDGWLNADLFVTGLRAAGAHPTQAKLVAALNKITGYTGGGLIPPVNWTVAHVKSPPPLCQAFVQASQGKFQPALGTGSSVFVCTVPTSASPAPAPAGTPGG
jgi:branched-chain amino acid transport system substrate-binding protein